MAMGWCRKHMSLDGVTVIEGDGMSWARWHRYVTVVYQVDEGHKRLIWVGPGKTARSLLVFFAGLGKIDRAA